MNRSLFLIQIRPIIWKFVLSNQSLSYPSVTKKKIIGKVCSVFAVESSWQLRVFLFWLQSKKKRITLIGDNSLAEREVIGYFFYCGYDYKPIVHLLKTHCDISLSERTLKRRLQKCNLRKNSNTDDSVLRTIINRELETLSQCLGYRGMWHLLRKSVSKSLEIELCKFYKKKTMGMTSGCFFIVNLLNFQKINFRKINFCVD